MSGERPSSNAISPTDVAIIGMAGRFPGAGNVDEFWENLRGGVESIRKLSEAELRNAGVSAAQLEDPNYVRSGAPLAHIELFDADFFGINPKEAAIMDPQQRLFLECAWEALEHSGHGAGSSDELTGVFAGSGPNSYLFHNLLSNRDLVESEGIFVLRHMGNDKDVLATRVSYQLNLHGPSVNVQTACSTSLVAVHLAAQSLIGGECDLALAGAVSIEIPQGSGYRYRAGEILSRDGHCRAFDAAASGTVFGSGLGIVVLRRLADALAGGDTIYAVIKGSAINNDGRRKVGFLAPSVEGQVEAVAQALAVSGVDAGTIDYIEAHGTGTAIGDPIEVAALGKVFGGRVRPLYIGAVKTNIGHLDTASGVAGLIKTVLALNRRELPSTLHYSEPNPRIDFQAASIKVVDRLMNWPRDGSVARAGVTSLGIGGSNAHVVLEEAPKVARPANGRPFRLLALSAKTPEALEEATSNLVHHIERHPGLDPDAAAYTLHLGRHSFPHRRTVVCTDARAASESLHDLDPRWVATAEAVGTNQAPVFLFSGQGAQCVDMGRGLYSTEPVFRRWIDECAAIARPILGVDFREVLYPPEDRAATASELLRQTWIAQSSLFAVEYALAQLWASWGVRPGCMLGHSVGEYVAACLAGVFTFEDAVKVVAARGRLMGDMAGGAMLAVALPQSEIPAWLGPDLSLAAVNGSNQCVIAGSVDSIQTVEQQLNARAIPARRLQTSHAFHSHLMEPAVARFVEALGTVQLNPPRIPIISNVTGQVLTANEATDSRYWGAHLRNTVRFFDGLSVALSYPTGILLEVGPGETLTSVARRHPGLGLRHTAVSSLPKPGDRNADLPEILLALGRLWVSGADVDWHGFHSGEQPARIPLPTYPFQRRRFWTGPSARPEPDQDPVPAVSRWFYQPVWRRAVRDSGETKPGPWLIFCDTGGAGRQLAEQLRKRRESVTTVSLRDCFERLDAEAFALNPGSESDFRALFESIPPGAMPNRVVYFWSMETATAPRRPEDLGFLGLMSLVKNLMSRAGARSIELCVFTQGASSVRGELVRNPAQATVAGPCRVAPLEYSNLTCRWIDMDGVEPGVVAGKALNEVLAGFGEGTVAYRDGARWIQELEPFSLHPTGSRLRERGVYLITGGLGGLGLAVAQWLCRTCQGRLVLVSRDATVRAAQRRAEIEAMEREGSEICICAADVSDAGAMRKALDEARRRFGAINGVIHAAGVIDDGVIELKSSVRAEQVLSPKLAGTRALDLLFQELPLDFMALFSSVSAVSPPPGQVDYCAANAYLNAYAESCPPARNVIAIGWSAWGEVGLARKVEEPQMTFRPPHPLLSSISRDSDSEMTCHGTLDPARAWIFNEHRLRGGNALFPGTGHLELVTAALWQKFGRQPLLFRDVTFLEPWLAEDSRPVNFRLSLTRSGPGFRFSTHGDEWEYASGGVEISPQLPPRMDAQAVTGRCPREEKFPKNTRQDQHVDFGPRWRSVQRLRMGTRECLAELQLGPEFSGEVRDFALHPALLDMATGAGLFLVPGYDRTGPIGLPFSYHQVAVYRPLPSHVYSHVRLAGAITSDVATFDVTIADQDGEVVMNVKEFTIKLAANPTALISRTRAPENREQRATVERNQDRDSISTRGGVEALSRILNSKLPPVVYVSARDPAPARRQADGGRRAKPVIEGDVEGTLTKMWQRLLGVEKPGLDTDFFQLGGHSLIAVRLFSEIRDVFNVDIGLATLFEARTIAALAGRIRGNRGEKNVSALPPCLVPIRREGSKPPCFLIHGVGGNVLNYEMLVRHLDPDQPVYGIQSRGVAGLETDAAIEDMAAHYLEEIRKFRPEGPYLLAGHSFGGLIAYEMGCQSEAAGTTPAMIALIDSDQRNSSPAGFWASVLADVAWLCGRLLGHIRRIVIGPDRSGYVRARIKTLRRKVRILNDRVAYRVGQPVNGKAPEKLRDVQRANWVALRRYAPRPSGCSITLFRCATRALGDHPDYQMGWRHLAGGGVIVHEVPGDHLSMMSEPHVEVLAQKLSTCLAASVDSRPSGRALEPAIK